VRRRNRGPDGRQQDARTAALGPDGTALSGTVGAAGSGGSGTHAAERSAADDIEPRRGADSDPLAAAIDEPRIGEVDKRGDRERTANDVDERRALGVAEGRPRGVAERRPIDVTRGRQTAEGDYGSGAVPVSPPRESAVVPEESIPPEEAGKARPGHPAESPRGFARFVTIAAIVILAIIAWVVLF
jgi:hypothetical protein